MTSKTSYSVLLKYLGLLMASAVVYGLRPYTFEFNSYHHEANMDFYKSINLQLVNYTGHQALNGCVVFNRDINDFDVIFKATVPNLRGNPLTVLNIKADGCQILEAGRKKSLKLIYQWLMEARANNSAFPSKCPMKKDTEYCFRNFYVDVEKLPQHLPEVKLNAQFGLQQKQDTIYKGFFSIVVESKDMRKKNK